MIAENEFGYKVLKCDICHGSKSVNKHSVIHKGVVIARYELCAKCYEKYKHDVDVLTKSYYKKKGKPMSNTSLHMHFLFKKISNTLSSMFCIHHTETSRYTRCK